MIVGFALVLSAGQFYSALLIVALSVLIFSEISGIKRNEEKEVKIPMTKYINWYLFLAFNYYSLGRFIAAKLPYLGVEYQLVGRMLTYHSFICFSLFIIGFLSFVLSLRQGFLKYQFRLFGWIVIATLLISLPAWSMIHNTYEGLVFFILPSMLIVVNDIFAYIFGYFFGRHPMIALSPKKTWEGYFGGAVSTCLFSIIVKVP
jgi:phosphatidate cytidylyltransferase